MTSPSPNAGLGPSERLLLVVLAVLLAAGLVWFRGGLHPEAPLERLARQSLDLPVALRNGKPTVVEFYADWCEACRSMAPAMETIEAQHRGELDVVLLNVDNPRWQPELERYDVNGIPQLELFNAAGTPVGRSIGARSSAELQALSGALIAGEPLPALAGMGAISSLDASPDATANVTESEVAAGAPKAATMAGPRSHA